MRNRMVLIAVALLAASPVMAWHDAGHKATARIAFDNLDRTRQLEIFEVLQAHPRYEEDFRSQMPAEVASGTEIAKARWAFQQAAIWPDLMRDADRETRARYHRGYWHYINFPVWLTADDAALESEFDHNLSLAFAPPLRQNLNLIQALRGNLAAWHDEGASDTDRALAFCWILHLTGDLHQPLHTVALFSKPWFPEGDRGGNGIEVVWMPENRNLHAVWDGLPTDMEDLTPTARTLRSIDEDVVDDAAIDEWVSHHASLANRFVYTDGVKSQLVERLSHRQSPLVELDHNYLVAARSLARRQVNLAGHRIAKLIE